MTYKYIDGEMRFIPDLRPGQIKDGRISKEEEMECRIAPKRTKEERDRVIAELRLKTQKIKNQIKILSDIQQESY